MSNVGEHARALSDELMKANPQLDGTFSTLPELEKLIKASAKDWNLQHMQRFGSYFGEVIRTGVPEASWVDYEGAGDVIRDLEKGDDINMLLQHGTQCVFPLVKVTKYRYNGSPDSVAAFGPVAVNMLKGSLIPKPKVSRPVDPEKFNEWQLKDIERINAFFSEPNDERFKDISRLYRNLSAAEIDWAFKKHTADPGIFIQFFDRKNEGRGYEIYRPSDVAESLLLRAIEVGAISKEASKLALHAAQESSNKSVKHRAAFLLARLSFDPNDMAAMESLFHKGGVPVRQGIVSAFASQIADDTWYKETLFEEAEGFNLADSVAEPAGDNLPSRLARCIKFLRLALADKNNEVKSSAAWAVPKLARERSSLFKHFTDECESLLQEKNLDMLKQGISIAIEILKLDNSKQGLIDGLVKLVSHKNGRMREEGWDALRTVYRNTNMPPEVAERLIPHLASPDKYTGVSLHQFLPPRDEALTEKAQCISTTVICTLMEAKAMDTFPWRQ